MTFELLLWDGCPSHPEALAELERILREEGVHAQVTRVEIVDDEQARRERFPGSPTIRIDGHDILAAEGDPYSLTCRVYRTRDGRISAVPDPEDIRAAVRRAR